MCTYLDVVVGLVWLNDMKGNAISGPPILSRLSLTLQTKMSSVAGHRQRVFPVVRLLILSGCQ